MKFSIKKCVVALGLVAFGFGEISADELYTRLAWNCVERMKMQNNNNKNYLAECAVKLETMVAQQGSDATIKEFYWIWQPQDMDNAVAKVLGNLAKELGNNDLNYLRKQTEKLEENGDYKTFACLYIGKSKCMGGK